MRKELIIIIALCLLPFAQAAVDVSYIADQKNVSSLIFNCLDSSCSTVSAFSGTITKGPNTTDGTITFRYPDSLATPYGYAEFFVSKGYRPLVGKHNWNTFGQTGIAQTSEAISFSKLSNVCRASISQLILNNTVQLGKPLSFQTNASLDSATGSAFQLANTGVGYLPPSLVQEYFGADTRIRFEILNFSTVIFSQEKNYTAQTNNSILAGSSLPAEFLFIPQANGTFTARVTSTVIDDACTSQEDQITQTNFSVTSLHSQFYTILSNLSLNTTTARIGQPIQFSLGKITNHVQNNQTITPVQTDLDVLILRNTTVVLNTTGTTYFANADPLIFSPITLSFTPTLPGVHTISIKARANSLLPTTDPEITAETSLQFSVSSAPLYNFSLSITDGTTGLPIPLALVNISGKTATTNASGIAQFFNITEGNYPYTLNAQGYAPINNSISVFNTFTQSILLYLGNISNSTNTPPLLDLPVNLTIIVNGSATINLSDYAFDNQDADSFLKYTVTGNTNITVKINNSIATIIPNASFIGTNALIFTVFDLANSTARDTITLIVVPTASAPKFNASAAITLAEDTPAQRTLDLFAITSDPDTPLSDLTYSLNFANTSLFTATIEQNHYLTIIPNPNVYGNSFVTIKVNDSIGSSLVNISVNISPVNDAPVVLSIPTFPASPENNNISIDLRQIFFDPDNDILAYDTSPTANLTFVFNTTNSNNQTLLVIPQQHFFGTRQFNLSATDPSGSRVIVTLSLTFSFANQPPYFTTTIPNLTTFEEQPTSIDLTPYESDPEDGIGANNNNLTWKFQLANQSNLTPVTALTTPLFTATLNSSTDLFVLTPFANQSGSQNITLILFDSGGKNTSQNITLTILNVNDAPVFVNLTSQLGEAGKQFFFAINATDSDPTNDVLIFSANTSLFTINNQSGIINFTPAFDGIFTIPLRVCDNFNSCTNSSFVLTVSDTTPPSPGLQAISPLSSYFPNSSYTFISSWTDNGNITTVAFEIDNKNFTNTTQNGSVYSVTVLDLSAGNHTFRWYATDSANNTNKTNSTTFTITQATSALVLLINGSANNLTTAINSPVIFFANLTNTSGPVKLLVNSSLVFTNTTVIIFNQTFTTPGTFNITATFDGNQNFSTSTLTRSVTALDVIVPSLGSEFISSTNASFGTTITLRRNITDDVAIVSATLQVDAQNFSALRVGTSNTYEVNLTNQSSATHFYKWFANDTSNNSNSTPLNNFTITPAQSALVLLLNNAASNLSIAKGSTIQLFANLTNTTGTVSLSLDGTLLSSGVAPLLISQTFSSAGIFNITALFAGTTNFLAANITRSVIVSDQLAPLFGTEAISPINSSQFSTAPLITFRRNITDDVAIANVTLEIDSANQSASRVGTTDTYEVNLSLLSSGNHTYKWSAFDTSNNKNVTSSATYTVLPAMADLVLLLNGSSANITILQGTTIAIFTNLTNTSGTVTLNINGTQIASGTAPLNANQQFNTQGTFAITATFAGNTNFANATLTRFVNVPDTTPPNFGTQTLNPTSPANFSPQYTFRRDVTDNVAIGSVSLELDSLNRSALRVSSTNTFETNISNLSVGNHTYKWFANDTSANTNSTNSDIYTITQGTGNITLSLNGAAGDTSAQVNDTVIILATLVNPASGFVSIYANGVFIQNGSSPLNISTIFASTGTFTITANFSGDTNTSPATVQRTLTITPPIGISSFNPPTSTNLTYSSFIMTLNTSGATSCKWSFNDSAQTSMTNNFSTTNSTAHTANISGLSIGTNNISVACNNQSASTNTDLSYTTQNILDGSVFSGTNSITNSLFINGTLTSSTLIGTNFTKSFVTNSTLLNVSGTNNTITSSSLNLTNSTNATLTNVSSTKSTINNSQLKDCIVINSVVKKIVATNCTFTDSFVDPSNLTGSTISGSSTIIESMVTFSNVSNTTITNSTISKSNITASNLTNSSFSFASLQNATITNNQITSGTITVLNVTYNASISGAANLSQVIPLAPQANFTSSSVSISSGSTIALISTSSDPNIPGSFNDSLRFNWSLGDSSTSNSSSLNKTYPSAGTYLVTLTVTDSYNLTSTATTIITVSDPVSSSSGSSGGGGGGGSRSGGSFIAGGIGITISSTPISRVVKLGQPMQVNKGKGVLPFGLILKSVNTLTQTSQWSVGKNIFTLTKSGTFDLDRDGIDDVLVQITDLGRNAATVQLSIPQPILPEVPLLPTTTIPTLKPTTSPKQTLPPDQQPLSPTSTEETPTLDTTPTPAEITVPLTAEVTQSLLARLKDSLRLPSIQLPSLHLPSFVIGATSVGVQILVVLGIVLLGLLGYSIFLRITEY